MQNRSLLCSVLVGLPLLTFGCADDTTAEGSTGSSSGTTNDTDSTEVGSNSGDGDGDPATGDGDGEPSGDGDPAGDGDGDPSDCEEGEEQCVDGEHQLCEGGKWENDPCAEDSFCDEGSGSCVECLCEPGVYGDCIDDNNIGLCADDCSEWVPEPCEEGVCIDAECVPLLCVPDQPSCIDDGSYHECNGEGTAWGDPIECPPGDVCAGGDCVSACALAELTKSNVGCEFWAVDMENLPPRDGFTYAVAVSNPSFDEPATISFWDANGGAEGMLFEEVIPPRAAEVFNLSGSHAGLIGHYPGDAGFVGTGIREGRAFRLESSIPVLAAQFNPVGGAVGNTTDASLLLPTHALGLDYLHLAWNVGHGNGSSMDIVATADNTTVTITPTVNTPGGVNGLPAMTAGVPTAVVINKYDYIQVNGGNANALTGTEIASDKPVAVFGGHTCGDVPTNNVSACDHLEEQIFPLETWGTNYVGSRNPSRGGDAMTWRIIAAEDGTDISFEPPVSIGAQTTLDAGEMVQFDELQDFYISADGPILVAGYMQGCTAADPWQNNVCVGDPYMVLMVPVEQYRDDYVFLVDSSYDEDFAKLVRPAGAEVDVACLGVVPEDRWTSIGASGWEWAVIDMNPGEAMCATGTNQAISDEGFGVIISGQSNAASYAYPGGLALEAINPQ